MGQFSHQSHTFHDVTLLNCSKRDLVQDLMVKQQFLGSESTGNSQECPIDPIPIRKMKQNRVQDAAAIPNYRVVYEVIRIPGALGLLSSYCERYPLRVEGSPTSSDD